METFERKAYEKLAFWKDSSRGSTALLIEGARRVGKSTIAEEFGRRNYASYMLVDFSKAPDDVLGYFVDLRNDLDAFFMYLSSFYGVELHRKAMRLFREYMLVGGMPQAVSKYVETHDFSKVDNVKRNILRLHRQDISKHGGSDRDDPSNRMEIDFLIVEPYENAAMKYRVSPIEVKSSKNYRTVSLDKFKTKFDKKVGTRYVLHPKPLVVENDVVKLPIYMAGLL